MCGIKQYIHKTTAYAVLLLVLRESPYILQQLICQLGSREIMHTSLAPTAHLHTHYIKWPFLASLAPVRPAQPAMPPRHPAMNDRVVSTRGSTRLHCVKHRIYIQVMIQISSPITEHSSKLERRAVSIMDWAKWATSGHGTIRLPTVSPGHAEQNCQGRHEAHLYKSFWHIVSVTNCTRNMGKICQLQMHQ